MYKIYDIVIENNCIINVVNEFSYNLNKSII